MGFFSHLEQMASGTADAATPPPPHNCGSCRSSMAYRGPHALRTGGLQRGIGVGADLLFGAGADDLFNQATERNVVVHVMVCPNCGEIAFINDPRRGF
jgi:hypothetical protein